jgi:hypothetical protein
MSTVYLLRVNFVGALVCRAAFSDRDAGWRFASLGWLGPLELCFAWFANVQLIICVVKMLRGKSPKQPTAVITAQRTQEQRGRATRDSPSSGCNGPQNRFRKGVERGSFIEIPRSIIVCLLTPSGAKRNAPLDDAVDLVLDEASLLF